MIKYKDELICDLLETYHIFDYHGVPVKLLCTLCSGLGPDSRIGMKLSGRKAPMNTILLAMIYDYFAGADKDHVRILPNFLEEEEDEENVRTFMTGAEYEEARRKALGG